MGIRGYLIRVTPERLDELLIMEEIEQSNSMLELFGEPGDCDVDKAWELIEFGIYRLADLGMCRDVQPLTGGRPTCTQGDHGPVTFFDRDEVCELVEVLESITREMYDLVLVPDALDEFHIYPGTIWHQETRDEFVGYVWDWFQEMLRYYREACVAGNAMVLRLV